MKTIQLNLYPFAELSAEGKEKAIAAYDDINVFDRWWEGTYGDAENAGLKITGFELGRGKYCNADFMADAIKCASLVIAGHGEKTTTYQIASAFREERDSIVIEWPKETNGDFEDVEGLDNALDEVEERFLKSMQSAYLKILDDEYDYLTSEAAITYTIIANEYYFTKDGQTANHLETLAS
ncbi:hypothetical protein SAMN05216464_110104 [Mucilaginibacter pineti]|uniref:Uncharacterized protein n=1 Tax=Mucilaginibacter pineti TaxID=1391627 RepID=A0A1G7GEA2_9SPHI|nr:hypothetical protein [Mucilaginibacter pineti]SDE86454.1 hypothetical protein SAMN05216464_110104 [Mucilaginibacter pineti]